MKGDFLEFFFLLILKVEKVIVVKFMCNILRWRYVSSFKWRKGMCVSNYCIEKDIIFLFGVW